MKYDKLLARKRKTHIVEVSRVLIGSTNKMLFEIKTDHRFLMENTNHYFGTTRKFCSTEETIKEHVYLGARH